MQTLKSTGCVLDVRAAPGNKFVDVSRYHHTITNNNVVTTKGMDDALGGGYNGSTAYLDCGNHSSLNITNAITIEAWVKPTSAALSGFAIFVGKDYIGHECYIFGLNSGKIYAKIGVTDLSIGINTLTADVYQHVAFTFNDSTNEIIAYINGNMDRATSTAATLGTSTRNLWIGAREWGGSPLYFNGSIFLAHIYNRALPASEILDHYYEYATLLGLD